MYDAGQQTNLVQQSSCLLCSRCLRCLQVSPDGQYISYLRPSTDKDVLNVWVRDRRTTGSESCMDESWIPWRLTLSNNTSLTAWLGAVIILPRLFTSLQLSLLEASLQ